MTRSILKTLFVGVLVGLAAFFIPHLLIGIIALCFIARLLHCGCGHHHRGNLFVMADKIRAMSDEEYAEFKNNHSHGCCGSHRAHHRHRCGCCCGNNCDCKSENKSENGCGCKSGSSETK